MVLTEGKIQASETAINAQREVSEMRQVATELEKQFAALLHQAYLTPLSYFRDHVRI